MSDSLLDPVPEVAPAGPAVPEKFLDHASGGVRVDALLQSYLELERKLGGMIPVPGEDAPAEEVQRFRQAIGVPASAEDYQPQVSSEFLKPDPELHRRLHQAGFTPAQVQLVYDLAGDHVVPLLQDLGSQFEMEREQQRLSQHFGGEERWRETSRQLSAWGKANLPEPVFAALSCTADGVLALHAMMRSGEPSLRQGADAAEPLDASALDQLIRDPRYWRDRDPQVVARVTDGFKRLYSG